MISSALIFLLNVIFGFLTMLFLLRFFMQLFKAPFYNPFGQLVITLTDFAVKPARKIIPSWGKIDLSTLFLALLAQFLLQTILLWLRGMSFSAASAWPVISSMAVINFVRAILDLFFYTIALKAILSWVNPNTPIAPILTSLTKPILKPIQRIIPLINSFDFSPMVAMVLIKMVDVAVLAELERLIFTLF